METFVAFIGGLTLLSIVLFSQLVKSRFEAKTRHINSLYRLEDAVRLNLPPVSAELIEAVIEEEIGKV